MNKPYYVIILLAIFVSCKNNQSSETEELVNKTEEIIKTSTFDSNLIDLREVNEQFTSQFIVDKFGMQKVNDSIFNFVFKLNKSTSEETVKNYSIGIRGFNPSFNYSYSPELEHIEQNKYLVLRKNLKDRRSFDSLDVYIYERKNWQKSGRLGGIVIRDVFLNKE